jgi:hypothetical protein
MEEIIMEYTLDDRISLLGLTEKRIEEVMKLEFESIWLDNDVIDEKQFREENIEVDDIVGICNRIDQADNWIDLLGALHKMRNFDDYKKYQKQQFDVILVDPERYGIPVPKVISHQGKLYIAGEGKHRMTMAKCIGAKSAKVHIGY